MEQAAAYIVKNKTKQTNKINKQTKNPPTQLLAVHPWFLILKFGEKASRRLPCSSIYERLIILGKASARVE